MFDMKTENCLFDVVIFGNSRVIYDIYKKKCYASVVLIQWLAIMIIAACNVSCRSCSTRQIKLTNSHTAANHPPTTMLVQLEATNFRSTELGKFESNVYNIFGLSLKRSNLPGKQKYHFFWLYVQDSNKKNIKKKKK